MIFRAKLSKGGHRFNDPENGKPVYEWYDQRGYVYLGQKRYGKMVFFSHENIEKLPNRQQRRAAIKRVNKMLEREVNNRKTRTV